MAFRGRRRLADGRTLHDFTATCPKRAAGLLVKKGRVGLHELEHQIGIPENTLRQNKGRKSTDFMFRGTLTQVQKAQRVFSKAISDACAKASAKGTTKSTSGSKSHRSHLTHALRERSVRSEVARPVRRPRGTTVATARRGFLAFADAISDSDSDTGGSGGGGGGGGGRRRLPIQIRHCGDIQDRRGRVSQRYRQSQAAHAQSRRRDYSASSGFQFGFCPVATTAPSTETVVMSSSPSQKVARTEGATAWKEAIKSTAAREQRINDAASAAGVLSALLPERILRVQFRKAAVAAATAAQDIARTKEEARLAAIDPTLTAPERVVSSASHGLAWSVSLTAAIHRDLVREALGLFGDFEVFYAGDASETLRKFIVTFGEANATTSSFDVLNGHISQLKLDDGTCVDSIWTVRALSAFDDDYEAVLTECGVEIDDF